MDLDLSPENIRWMIQALIILVLSIAVHEFGHAIVAYKLGDGTPKNQGRVTLNPLAHADPIGTLAFPVMGLLFTGGLGFGWGRPVMVNPVNFTRKLRMRVAHMFVAFAGPAMNVLFAVFIAGVHFALLKSGVMETSHEINRAISYAVLLNFILFFFNLIPAYPLDGGAVLEGLLPDRMLPKYQSFAVYGPFVLMAVIFIPGMYKIFVVPARFLHENLYSLMSLG